MDKYINFNLLNENSDTISIAETLKNHNVWLFFYRGRWWGTWAKQISQVRENYEKIKNDYNTIVLGVSADDLEAIKEYKDRLSLPFSLLSDPTGEVIKKYGLLDTEASKDIVLALSANIVINQNGDLVFFHKGTNKERPTVDDMLQVLETKL